MQAPKVQASKEAKALAASNSSKGKKKVRPTIRRPAQKSCDRQRRAECGVFA